MHIWGLKFLSLIIYDSDFTSIRVEIPNRSDWTDHGRGTVTFRQRCHQFGPGWHQGFYISKLNCSQKDGEYCLVINLKALTNYILEEYFKMEGFHMVRELIIPKDWLVKIDLKNVYLLVRIHLNHHKYLQFHWQPLKYQLNCLPLGCHVHFEYLQN